MKLLQILSLCILYTSGSYSFTLVTFDVDGTLVQGSGQAAAESAHALAFSHAVGTILGDGTPVASCAEALPKHLYHGSTDGLILLRLAKATLDIDSSESFPKLPQLMDCMYEYIHELEDDEIARYLSPLPGVVDNLQTLKTMENVQCGLVTGNVEGIARRKIRAVGIWDTGALSPPCSSQKSWKGSDSIGFLGGFGSDYCSGDIDDLDRNFLDRGEQIAIATERCKNQLSSSQQQGALKRVVHVGDAPADVLAAKSFSDNAEDNNICVGMVAVATGSYSAMELHELAGNPIPGKWEPIILEDGIADPSFLSACGL